MKPPSTALRQAAVWMIGACLALPIPSRAALPPEEAGRLLDEGLDHFYNLEYDQAIPIFESLRANDSRSPTWQNYVAIGYFYQQLYQAGALEGDLFGASNKFFRTKRIKPDPILENRFQQANQAALRICEQRLKEDARDEEALYACGVAYAARATHQGLVERSALDFLGNARRANDYHSRLARANPRHYDAYLIPGLYDFVLGSLPGPVKVLFFFAGLSGDKQRGIRLVESVVAWGNGARQEARILLTVMYRREKRFADARRTMQELAAAFPRNYIFPLEIASIRRAAGEIPDAIREYERVVDQVRSGTPGFQDAPLARIHYELGDLYRKAGDLEAARGHLQQVAGARGSTPELEKESASLRRQIEEALEQQKLQTRTSLATP